MAETTNNSEQRRRASEPLVLALIGLAIAALLFAGAAVPVLLSREDDAGESDPTTISAPASEPTAVDEANSAPPTTPGTSATPESAPPDADAVTTTIAATATTAAAPTTTIDPTTTDSGATTTVAPTTNAAAPTTTAVAADGSAVPESRATVRGGQIFLEGAVPDDAARNEIVALVTEIFGPDNVIDEYVVDPRAGDPNLGNVQVSDAVLFETESAIITPAFEPLLNQGLALLQLRPSAEFAFEGHTDSRGSDLYNFFLSQHRADAVVRWYTDRGVDASRLSASGLGESEPIASNDTSEGRQMNRRIEVTIDNLLSGSE